MNTTYINNKMGVFPKVSLPCEILDHEFLVYGPNAYTAAIPKKGKCFHGVVH